MKVFVGCSSRDNIDSKYFDLAREVGKRLQGCELVIGGTIVGMMGVVANTFSKDAITQIILKDYLEEGSKLNKGYVCDTSFERMKLIWEECDVILFLPGGTGTLGEIFTFLEENRSKTSRKKIVLLNYDHYYDMLISFIESMKEKEFSSNEILDGLVIIQNEKELEGVL